MSSSSNAWINQSGNRNFARQDQNIQGTFNDATIKQSGNDNSARQTQDGNTTWNHVSTTYINQSGNGNTAVQEQSTAGNDGNAGNPTDDANYARIDQEGNNGRAFQYQNGLDDFAKIMQKGGNGNYGFQMQDIGSEGAEARLLQNGSNNWSQQWQYGTDNTSSVNQTGNGMWSKVTQTGYGNSGTVTQTH